MSVVNLKSLTDLSGFYIVYQGSTLIEIPGWRGLSHLMEHLIYHSLDKLLDDFDRYGIENNAYTSSNNIVFTFAGLDEYLKDYRESILENLLKFQITEEQFENERKIVLEEYKDYFNKQNYRHAMNLNRKLFNDYDAIGSREDLENLTYKDIIDYFKLLKPQKIINVSKYSDFETDIEFLIERFDNIIKRDNYQDITYEPFNFNADKSSIINVSEVITEDFPYIQFLTQMLGYGLKSPLYQELREKKGLVYYVSIGFDKSTLKSGVITIASETSNENVEEFQNTLEEVLSNPDKYMTQERFDIIKEAINISLKKQKINRYKSINKYIYPNRWNIESILKDLTLNKVMEYYEKYFNFNSYYKSIDTQEQF